MSRYLAAVVAALSFTFTGQPSGLRLLIGLAAANLCLHIWARLRPETQETNA